MLLAPLVAIVCPVLLCVHQVVPLSAGGTPIPLQVGDTGTVDLLSVDILERMVAFSERFRKEPPRIRDTAAQSPAVQTQFKLVITAVKGIRLPAVFNQTDMGLLAAQFPSVADDFKETRLTPQQLDRYKRALYLAVLTGEVERAAKLHGDTAAPPAQSVTWKNVEFLRAHPNEYANLKRSVWLPHVQPSEVPMASDTVNQQPF